MRILKAYWNTQTKRMVIGYKLPDGTTVWLWAPGGLQQINRGR
jgi:hypothetical protein